MKTKQIIRGLSLILCIWWIGTVQAQYASDASLLPDTSMHAGAEQLHDSLISQHPDSMGGMMLKTMLSLFIVISVVCIVAVFFKRFVNKGGMSGYVGIHVVGTRYISPKKQIYVVDVQEKRLVIGVTDTNISKLAEIEQTEESCDQQDSRGSAQQRPSFKAVFSSLTKRRES